jgi:hypothetical protein
VPLAPSDLLEPQGPISPTFFPNESESALAERLQAYLDDGAQRAVAGGLAADDRAVLAWGEYRALNAVVLRLATESASVTIQDQGSRTRTVEQLRTITAARDMALDRWNLAVPAPQEMNPRGGTLGRSTSGSTPIVYEW